MGWVEEWIPIQMTDWLGPGRHRFLVMLPGWNSDCRLFARNAKGPSYLKAKWQRRGKYREIRILNFSHFRATLTLFPEIAVWVNTGSSCICGISKSLREKTDEPFRISTNGSRLPPEMIQSLEKVNPIFLDVSLNSALPERRSWLMEDPHPEIALIPSACLKNARIPYSVVIVLAFSNPEIMLKDLRETVAFASSHGSKLYSSEPTRLFQIFFTGRAFFS